MKILVDIFLIFFWALVLAFVPISLFFILKESQSEKDERARDKGVFFIRQESVVLREKRFRLGIALLIYGACLAIFCLAYIYHRVNYNVSSLDPFDILSALSVILFIFAIVSYLPIALYISLRERTYFDDERAYLKSVFKIYTWLLFIFCMVFAAFWIKTHQIPVKVRDMLLGFSDIVLGSITISYIPVLVYTILKEMKPLKIIRVRPKIIFLIYVICFLTFSSVYILGWAADNGLCCQYRVFKAFSAR